MLLPHVTIFTTCGIMRGGNPADHVQFSPDSFKSRVILISKLSHKEWSKFVEMVIKSQDLSVDPISLLKVKIRLINNKTHNDNGFILFFSFYFPSCNDHIVKRERPAKIVHCSEILPVLCVWLSSIHSFIFNYMTGTCFAALS